MKQTPIKHTHSYTVDALRVIAILAVLLIHTTTKSLASGHFQLDKLFFPLLLNQLSRFAVPLFFLISGFVLELNYKNKLSSVYFFRKRTQRVIIPYIFWSIFYFILAAGRPFSEIFSLKFIDSLLLGKASYQLYFIPTLIIFYIFFPFMHKLMPVIKKWRVFFLLIVIQVALMTFDYYIESITYKQPIRIALLSFLPFIIGMVASHHQDTIYVKIKKYFTPILLFLFLLLPIIYYHCKILVVSTHKTSYLYSQYHPLNYLYTVVLTIVLFYLFETKLKANKFVAYLSRLSFFVFFLHVFIQSFVWDHAVEAVLIKSYPNLLFNWWFDISFFATVAIASFIIAAIIHKLPYIKTITG